MQTQAYAQLARGLPAESKLKSNAAAERLRWSKKALGVAKRCQKIDEFWSVAVFKFCEMMRRTALLEFRAVQKRVNLLNLEKCCKNRLKYS